MPVEMDKQSAELLAEIKRHASLPVFDSKKQPANYKEHEVSFREEQDNKVKINSK